MCNSISQVPINIYKVPQGCCTVLTFYNKGTECRKDLVSALLVCSLAKTNQMSTKNNKLLPREILYH